MSELNKLNATGKRIKVNCELQFNHKTQEITLAMSIRNKKLPQIKGKSALSVAYSTYAQLSRYINKLGGTFTTSQASFTTYMQKFLIDFGRKYNDKTIAISEEYNDFFFELYDVNNSGVYAVPFSSYWTDLPDILPVMNPVEKEGGKVTRLFRKLSIKLSKKPSHIS